MKRVAKQFWTLFYYGVAETICSKHKSLRAAKRAARLCEKSGGARHRIVERSESLSERERGKVNSVVGHFDYVRRCKTARGDETHKTTHAARGSSTLCGKLLGGMWYVLSAWGRTSDGVDCRKCRRALKANKMLTGGEPVAGEPYSGATGSEVHHG